MHRCTPHNTLRNPPWQDSSSHRLIPAAAAGAIESAAAAREDVIHHHKGRVNDKFEKDDENEYTLQEYEDLFVQIMHDSRKRELLLLAPDSKLHCIHKFSLVCPAHVVAAILCCWFMVIFTIFVLSVSRDSLKYTEIDKRLHQLELKHFNNASTLFKP
jgi:hypothetical protein